jgi:hypothetical protein
MNYQVPHSIKTEHEILHSQLLNAIESGGRTGDAATIVAQRLHVHFEKEEAFAMPPLGLLASLADGKVSADMKKTIELSEKLKAELPKLRREHLSIVDALNNLVAAALSEKKMSAVEFANELKLHAQSEEEVMYPAAILVGEYLKLALNMEKRQSIERKRAGSC